MTTNKEQELEELAKELEDKIFKILAFKIHSSCLDNRYLELAQAISEKYVRIEEKEKPRAKVPEELDRSFFCQSKDGYLLGVAIITLIDTLNELIAWAKEIEKER